MGRKKLPENVKKLKGTDRDDRSIDSMNPEAVEGLPKPPSHLNERAVKVWEEYAEKLTAVGVLRATDIEMFAAFCCEAANYREAVELLNEEGKYVEEKYSDGSVRAKRRHPAITVLNNSFGNMKAIASEFGLSPHARQGIEMNKDESEDPLEAHMNKKTG